MKVLLLSHILLDPDDLKTYHKLEGTKRYREERYESTLSDCNKFKLKERIAKKSKRMDKENGRNEFNNNEYSRENIEYNKEYRNMQPDYKLNANNSSLIMNLNMEEICVDEIKERRYIIDNGKGMASMNDEYRIKESKYPEKSLEVAKQYNSVTSKKNKISEETIRKVKNCLNQKKEEYVMTSLTKPGRSMDSKLKSKKTTPRTKNPSRISDFVIDVS